MLSPIEIKKQEFGRAVRGYDTSEVRNFLETVAGEMEGLIELARVQANDIERLKVELTTFQRMEQNMKEALVNAQETLREAREGSQREADLRKREVEMQAEQILHEASKRRSAILREVDVLISRRDSFVRKLRNLLRSEVELLDLLEEQDISVDKPKDARAPNDG